jgi:lysophospholipase L1-like esterase
MTADLQASFVASLKRVEELHPTVQLTMSPQVLISLISLVQLALRHPGTSGLTGQTGRAWVSQVIDHLATGEPDLAAILKLGNDAAFDGWSH